MRAAATKWAANQATEQVMAARNSAPGLPLVATAAFELMVPISPSGRHEPWARHARLNLPSASSAGWPRRGEFDLYLTDDGLAAINEPWPRQEAAFER